MPPDARFRAQYPPTVIASWPILGSRRILKVTLADEGLRRLEAADPAVRALEADIERGFTKDEIAIVKTWLVEAAKRR